MLNKIRSFFRSSYYCLNKIEISSSLLIHNYKYLASLNKNINIAPVLKSNAYGHGIELIAKIISSQKPSFLCVDSLYEAYELSKKGIKIPILIMGYVHPDSLKVKKLPFSFAVFEPRMLYTINKFQPNNSIHLFVDTGMHREGILIEDLPKVIKRVQELHLNIEGLMSHLALGDKPANKSTIKQVENFYRARKIFTDYGVLPKWIHLSASLGYLYGKNACINENLVRLGIVLYGIDPARKNKSLRPVLQLKSTIIQIKDIKKGEKIGYDFSYSANKNMKIAVLPIGYNDGVDRRLSNKGFVKIGGNFCRIVGRVSMNITVIDISKLKKCHEGQEVIVYSNKSADKNSINNAAKICKTIPYELLVHLNPSIKRIVLP